MSENDRQSAATSQEPGTPALDMMHIILGATLIFTGSVYITFDPTPLDPLHKFGIAALGAFTGAWLLALGVRSDA